MKLDSVSFLFIWSSMIIWAIIASLCLLIGICSISKLPAEIPIQWSDGAAASLVNKHFIFAYPVVCIVIRIILRPCIYMKIKMYSSYGKLITEYLTNYLCFVALSAEMFSILFIYGLVKSIVALLFVDTAVLIGFKDCISLKYFPNFFFDCFANQKYRFPALQYSHSCPYSESLLYVLYPPESFLCAESVPI